MVHLRSTLLCSLVTLHTTLGAALPLLQDLDLGMNDAMFTSSHTAEVDVPGIVTITAEKRLMNDAMWTSPHPVDLDAGVATVSIDKRLNDALFTTIHPVDAEMAGTKALVSGKKRMNDALFTSPHPIDLDAGVAMVTVDKRMLNDALWTTPHSITVDSPLIQRQDEYPGESYAPHAEDEYSQAPTQSFNDEFASEPSNEDYPGESYARRSEDWEADSYKTSEGQEVETGGEGAAEEAQSSSEDSGDAYWNANSK